MSYMYLHDNQQVVFISSGTKIIILICKTSGKGRHMFNPSSAKIIPLICKTPGKSRHLFNWLFTLSLRYHMINWNLVWKNLFVNLLLFQNSLSFFFCRVSNSETIPGLCCNWMSCTKIPSQTLKFLGGNNTCYFICFKKKN